MDRLSSWKSLAAAALFGAQTPLFSSDTPSLGPARSCPRDVWSCPATDISDSCCVNTPGGQFAQTQFWNSDPQPGVPGYLGPNDTWTLHGLWPDDCNGSFDTICDCNRSGKCMPTDDNSVKSCYNKGIPCSSDYSNITTILKNFGRNELLDDMNRFWKGINGDDRLWVNEWSRHGTCVSTLDPKCYVAESYVKTQEVVDYVEQAVSLYKKLPTFEWLTAENITPSITARYTNQEIIAALTKPRGVSPVIGCSGPNRDELREVWYHFRVLGPLQSGKFEAQEPDFSGPGRASISCPPTGIKWFPKGYIPPIGDVSKGQLRVRLAQGSTHGCVIRAGVWFNTIGSGCATFTASTEGDSISLRSSGGPCGIVDDALVCRNGQSASPFKLVDGKIARADGDTKWYADRRPTGQEKETIFASEHAEEFQIEWQST